MKRAAFLLLPALALAACGADARAPAPRWQGAGSAAPVRGGVLRFSVVDDVRSIDPAMAYDEFTIAACRLLYDQLVDYAPALAPDPMAIVPSLAERWTISPDGLVYRFTLRAGITFSDGRPVRAGDFVYALDRLRAPETHSPGAAFFAGIASMTAADERHLELRLAEPDASFLMRLALPYATPLEREAVGDGAIGDTTVGTGPFVLVSWRRGQKLTFARNPRYWDGAVPLLDGVEILPLIPREVAALKFFAGELETVDRLGPDDYLRVAAAPDWADYLFKIPSMQVFGEGMNVTRKPFDDRRVRLAMNYAIDKESTVQVSNGRAIVARGILPPLVPGHDPTLPIYPHDPARARLLLAEAGYPGGFDVTYTTILDGQLQLIAQSLQADLAEVGVRVHLQYLSFPAYLTAVGRGELDFFFAAWSMDFPDPVDFLEVLFHSKMVTPENSQNTARYQNPTLDALLDGARKEPDPARRMELYRSAERVIHDDAPWVFHYHPVLTEVRQPYVMGYAPHPVWLRDYRRTWLDLPRRAR